MGLLLIFEFVNLLLHPVISKMTRDYLPWMFMVMVLIAALLVPAHHRLEKWIIARLAEKNRRIRLAAAKRTIAALEN